MKILYIVGNLSYPCRISAQNIWDDLLNYMSNDNVCDVIGFSFNNKVNLEKDVEEIRKKLPKIAKLIMFKKNSGALLQVYRIMFMLGLRPLTLAFCYKPFLKRKITKLINKGGYDIVHFCGYPLVSQYGVKRNKKTVITYTDPESIGSYDRLRKAPTAKLKIQEFYKYISNFMYEKNHMRKHFFRSVVVSEVDKNYLIDKFNHKNVSVIPVHVFRRDHKKIRTSYVGERSRDILVLRPSNIDELRWFFTQVYKGVCTNTVTILTNQSLIAIAKKTLNIPSNVVFKEWVDDIVTLIRSHGVVAMLDDSGTGMSTRALFCLALGVKVVGTTQAFRGVSINGVEHAFATNKPDEFHEYIRLCLAKSDQVNIHRAEILKRYSYHNVMKEYEQLYGEISGL